jgi:hypothetical protein
MKQISEVKGNLSHRFWISVQKPAVERSGGGWGNSSPLPYFPFEDDVTVILLLAVSFMNDTFPSAKMF